MKLVDMSIEIGAQPSVVFELFTTAEGLCRWMSVDADVDLRPGGAWRWMHEDGNVCSGTYITIDPPRHLAFTYGWESGPFADVRPGSTKVDVALEATESGTRLTLTHTGLTSERTTQHHGGWAHFLARLSERAPQEAATNLGGM